MTTYALLIYRTAPPAGPIPELDERQALSLREAARCARNEHERAQIDRRISQVPAPGHRWLVKPVFMEDDAG